MTPKTIIKNKSNTKRFLGYVPPNGVEVPANGSVVVDGDLVVELMAGKNKTSKANLKSLINDIRTNVVDLVQLHGASTNVITVSGDYTVDLNNGSDQVIVVNSTANTTVTLPAPRVGLRVLVSSQVNYNLTVNLSDSNVKFVVSGNSNANSLSFSTAAENKTGAALLLIGISDNRYLALKLSDQTLTVS